MFALSTKNGTAKRTTTMTTSRACLMVGDKSGRSYVVASSARPSGDGHFLQQLHVIERLAAAKDDRADGIVADHDRKSRLLAEQDIEAPEQSSPARQDDPLVDDVGRELGRRLFQRRE